MTDCIDTDGVTENQASNFLEQFITALPLEERHHIASTLLRLRKQLKDIIPAKTSIKRFVADIRGLDSVFSQIPLHLRRTLKTHLLHGIEHTISSSNASLAVFVISLCLIELSALRNTDRLDLEGLDVCTTVEHLNSKIIPQLSQCVLSLRTNIPDLQSWSLAMLLYTFRVVNEWALHNQCHPTNMPFSVDKAVLKHSSIPVVMRTLLKIQIKRKPFPIFPKPYTLFDILFSCAISGNYDLLNSAKVPNNSSSTLELSEPTVQSRKKRQLTETPSNYLDTHAIQEISVESLENALQTESMDRILELLCQLHALISHSDSHIQSESLTENKLTTALKCTTPILARIQSDLSESSLHPYPESSLYEKVYCCLVQLWWRASEQRILLRSLPQSYLWMTALMRPCYEFMSHMGFARAVATLSHFMTSYQALFRSSILASPHWYLQLITDTVIAVFDRLDAHKSSQELDDAMCSCIVSISRPYAALGADESDIRPELSRVIKAPLESIISRMVLCSSSAGSSKSTGLSSRIRDALNNYLLIPMIRTIDPWALGQARVGIRPAAAKVMLNQLLSKIENEWEGAHTLSKLELPRIPAVVGGLQVAEKLAVKRRK